jgi:hypothetical protein
MDHRHHALHGDGPVIMRSLPNLMSVPVLVALVVLAVGCSRQAETPATTLAGPASQTQAADVLESARVVALRAVAMTGQVATAGFTSRADLIASFATADFAPVLLDRTNEQLRDLAQEFVGQGIGLSSLRAVETPLSATAVGTDAGARVTVWSVLVIAVTDEGPARQLWRTVTLDLVESGGTWRVSAWDSLPGPTPLPPTDATFDDGPAFDGPLSWQAATFGGL